jgi:hypothetical protein
VGAGAAPRLGGGGAAQEYVLGRTTRFRRNLTPDGCPKAATEDRSMAIDATTKILIVLQAGTESHEGRARALHSVLYARELLEAGATVRLVFDGAGTAWPARWQQEAGAASQAARLFGELKTRGLVYEVCDYCAGRFDVREELVRLGEPLTAAYENHPSIAGYVAAGFQVWIL